MFFPSDCHVHTQFCDGKARMEQMAYHAYQMGYVALGFSPHSPLPFRNDYAMKPESEIQYRRKITELRRLYQGRMKIYMGIEWDYDTNYGFPLYDYRIGSVHQIRVGNTYFAIDNTVEELKKCIDIGFGGSTQAFLQHYFSLVETSCMRGGVDIVGHFDVYTKFNEGAIKLFDEDSALYRETAINALRRIVRKRPELIFEVNTGAMFRVGQKKPYPAPFLLYELAKLRAPITLTSDAHYTEALGFWHDEALELCYTCGHRTIYRLTDHGFAAFKL